MQTAALSTTGSTTDSSTVAAPTAFLQKQQSFLNAARPPLTRCFVVQLTAKRCQNPLASELCHFPPLLCKESATALPSNPVCCSFFTIRDVIQQYHPLALRFFLVSSQYRAAINYTPKNLEVVRTLCSGIPGGGGEC